MRTVTVIGGGASGLCAALSAREAGAEVVLLEHNDRLGRKLSATGNGKCNLGNAFLSEECYRGGDSAFVNTVFDKMSPEMVRAYLSGHGLFLKEKRGYFYPYSEQAASVVNFFASRLKDAGVKVRLWAEVTEVLYSMNNGGSFLVRYIDKESGRNEQIPCDSVIVASGGLAGDNLGAGPVGYEIAKSFGHPVTKLFPALVQLICKGAGTKAISGVRAEADVKLLTGNGLSAQGGSRKGNAVRTYSESGEVLFTDYGISGIAVMQLSRYASEALQKGLEAVLELDLMPGTDAEVLCKEFRVLAEKTHTISTEDMLTGFLPKKLLYKIICEAGVRAEQPFASLSEAQRNAIVSQMKGFRLSVTGTKEFASAQVTAGGIELGGIDAETMESGLRKGLYFTGELLDVDGTCGGYNLQFAFATGLLAGRAAARKDRGEKA
ncbi:MAG: aminoacetone oxidase family FAD-binding enzyme [Lachnospiraceae bacterium]|nr:aminoacetone oxidase family FAD-binding enzyme [Lachnospiraceae bacterium]